MRLLEIVSVNIIIIIIITIIIHVEQYQVAADLWSKPADSSHTKRVGSQYPLNLITAQC